MSESLKALIGLMSLLERHLEIVSLHRGEREIFQQILAASDRGNGMVMSQVLERSGVSRASTYRHVASLIDRQLVRESFVGGERLLSASDRSRELDHAIRFMARSLG